MGDVVPDSLKALYGNDENIFRCHICAGKMELDEACQNKCRFRVGNDNRILVFNVKEQK